MWDGCQGDLALRRYAGLGRHCPLLFVWHVWRLESGTIGFDEGERAQVPFGSIQQDTLEHQAQDTRVFRVQINVLTTIA